MEGTEAAPKDQRKNKSKNKKKEAEKTNDDGMKEAVEAINDAVIQKAVEAIEKAVDKNKSNPPGCKDARRKSDHKTSKSKTANMDKTSLKPLTVKFVPRGCHDSLKMVEERVVQETIKDNSKVAEDVTEERNDEDMYIVTLLKGLDTITEIAVAPLEEILCDARLDPDKKTYLEKSENCYKNASLLSKLGAFMDVIQTKTGTTPDIESLPVKITKMLIDINPILAEKLIEDDAIEKEWVKLTDLHVYIRDGIKPMIKIAIKNLLMIN